MTEERSCKITRGTNADGASYWESQTVTEDGHKVKMRDTALAGGTWEQIANRAMGEYVNNVEVWIDDKPPVKFGFDFYDWVGIVPTFTGLYGKQTRILMAEGKASEVGCLTPSLGKQIKLDAEKIRASQTR